MISPDEAWHRIAAQLAARAPLGAVRMPRREAAGRVLAEPLAATADVPGTDVSAMDGYALAGEATAGQRLPVAATVAAGDPPGLELPAGSAVRIMTGAPVPAGADRIIPVEATRRGPETPRLPRTPETPEIVELRAAPQAGDHIRRRGEIQRAGDPLLPAGTFLTPGALALLATHGHAAVPVHRLPSVAVLATGDEVVPADQIPGPGQLRDSHTDFLLAAGSALGLPPFTPLGIAPDRADELAALVRRGLDADVLLVCGGVSMGEFDLVEGVLERLGCRRHFDAVAVQPGKPMVFATHPGGIVFGLPGNPASVMVDFWLFVRPALARLAGHGSAVSWWAPVLPATLAAPLPAAPGRDRFLAAEVRWGAGAGGAPLVRPLPPRGSHDLVSYAQGTALVRVRAGAAPAPAGADCEILLLPPA